jgi:hypothetical protein
MFKSKAKQCVRASFLASVVLLLFTTAGFGQFRTDWRDDVDQVIRESDSLSLKSQKTFSLVKPYHPDKDIRETWYYTVKDGRVVIFEIRYVIDTLEYSEIYYLHRGRLICMEQYEAPYLSVNTDQLKWGEAYFFNDNQLKQYVITGKRHLENSMYDSKYESVAKFEHRFAELQRHMKYLDR